MKWKWTYLTSRTEMNCSTVLSCHQTQLSCIWERACILYVCYCWSTTDACREGVHTGRMCVCMCAVSVSCGIQFWIQVPLKSAQDLCDDIVETSDGLNDSSEIYERPLEARDTWHWWDLLLLSAYNSSSTSVTQSLGTHRSTAPTVDLQCGSRASK